MIGLLTVQRVSDNKVSHGGKSNLHALVESLKESEREFGNYIVFKSTTVKCKQTKRLLTVQQ